VLEAVLAGAAQLEAACDIVEVNGAEPPGDLSEMLEAASAVVFASPTYRADITWPLKALLDGMPRGFWGEKTAPLQAKACATVVTGASDHHFLGMDKLRSVLEGFFAMQVLSPGLYVQRSGFGDDGRLIDSVREVAELHGRALVDLAAAVHGSTNLRALRPLA
jgi:FMN reductase